MRLSIANLLGLLYQHWLLLTPPWISIVTSIINVGWNYWSIPKRRWCNCWSLGMVNQFHSTLHWHGKAYLFWAISTKGTPDKISHLWILCNYNWNLLGNCYAQIIQKIQARQRKARQYPKRLVFRAYDSDNHYSPGSYWQFHIQRHQSPTQYRHAIIYTRSSAYSARYYIHE